MSTQNDSVSLNLFGTFNPVISENNLFNLMVKHRFNFVQLFYKTFQPVQNSIDFFFILPLYLSYSLRTTKYLTEK